MDHPSSAPRHPPAALDAWTRRVFERCGVSAADAALAAGVLLRTSLRGIDTHGLARVPVYADKLRAGEVDPRGRPASRWLDGALRVDGARALGQVAASEAVREAVDATRERACVACVIADSGHLSALGVYVLQAAEQGRVALLAQSTPPIMGLPGTRGGAIGNNPLAFAAPLRGRPPLVFDMAASRVARGHVMQAAREGRPIPDDWALDADGLPTTDPAQALRGAMQPMAGHKGLGLAMMVECLAAGLAGAQAAPGRADNVGSASGVSAFLLVLNPALWVGRAAFDASMDSWLDHYLQASGPQGRYPGQRQAECEAQRLREGVPVPEGLARELRACGEKVGVPFD